MRLALFATAVMFVALTACAPTQWKEVSSPEGGFTVLMPGEATRTTEVTNTRLGPIDQHAFAVQHNGYEWWVRYGDLGRNLNEGGLANRIFDYVRDPLTTTAKARLVSETSISLGGYPGRQWHFEPMTVQGIIMVRVFIVGPRMYMMGVSAATEKDISADIDRFFQSFRLIPKNK